jgi:hypothetical protein
MNSTSFRRTVAVVGTAAILSISTTSASTAGGQQERDQQDTAQDRPCFMVRASWNTALDGPQPTCPVQTGAAQPAPPRVTDFMP